MTQQTILITGGAGFIGSNFVRLFSEAHPAYRLVDLDLMTYAGREEAFAEQAGMPNVTPVRGDIRDAALVGKLFEAHDVTGVIHFAAESHVDNSIRDPLAFVRTNVEGTATLLHAALRHWTRKGRLKTSRFHHISTDEVYGSLGPEGFFTETTPYAPRSPYSASKAASDHLVRACGHTYGMNVTITNCSNNYGPGQHAEKLIPTVIRKCLAGEPIPVYGTGKNVRDWLWVEDHCRAVDEVFHRAAPGAVYNVGGRNERSNLEIISMICAILDELQPANAPHERLVSFVEDRPGHDFRYAIDPSKIEAELGWRAETSFDEGLRRTVEWYLARLS